MQCYWRVTVITTRTMHLPALDPRLEAAGLSVLYTTDYCRA